MTGTFFPVKGALNPQQRFIADMKVYFCGFGVTMSEQRLDVLTFYSLFHQMSGKAVPLRYNKDKRKNPVFSRVSAFVVAYSIPFPTLIVNEKSVE